LYRFLLWLQSTARICWEAVLVSLRGTEVVLRLSPLLFMAPASVFADPFLKHNVVADFTWRYVTDAMQGLGPAFVKLCQWVATRRDIFPPHVCDRLSELHDRGNPHSWASTHAALVEAFGPSYLERGLQVDDKKNVLGCGSAAQVYKGSLTTKDENGRIECRPVAIKVLHPRFKAMVERDLWFMQSMANLLHSLPIERIKMLNLPRATDNFGSVLRRQADLRIEADNLKQFRANFYRDEKDEAESAILFPRPVDGWLSHNVLVETLVSNGRTIAEFIRDGSEEGTEVRKELAGPLLRAFLKMVFLDNFVHGDLHPGNVLVCETTVQTKPSTTWWGTTDTEPLREETKRTIVLLDAGIATSLSPEDRRNLLDLFRAVILNRGEEAGRLMVERAKYERCSQVEGGVDAFAKGIDELVSEFHDRRKEGLTLGAVRIGSLLSRVLDLCRVHGVEIDPSMASIVISTLVLEGLGRSLEPSLNLMDFAVPFVLGRGRV
jgi:aarF domain-containing kinase